MTDVVDNHWVSPRGTAQVRDTVAAIRPGFKYQERHAP